MESFEIKGTTRKSTGKTYSKKLRNNETVPCVLYGGKENKNFEVPEASFLKLVYTPKVYSVKLNIDGKEHVSIIKDIQYHPTSDKILHVDFYEVAADKAIVMNLPIRIEGFSVGVKEGGKLVQERRKMKVRGLIKNLPDTLPVDITNLAIGKSIKAGELSFENLEVVEQKDVSLVSVKSTRATATDAAAPAAGAPAAAAPAPAKK
jgi:large subunit ribosomal protein L25